MALIKGYIIITGVLALREDLNDKNIIKSTIKVFELLEVLADNGKLNIAKLSQLTGFSKSTTQRIVNTLAHLRYIQQDKSTLEYFPSVKLYELGNKVVKNMTIRNIARPHMLKLYNELNETINLGVLYNNSVIYLDKLVSKSPLKAELSLGVEVPIYCSALGKVLAAFSDEEFSFEGSYVKYTENTIASDEELHEELLSIREQGYAVDNEEYVTGLVCIAVPILNRDEKAIASMSVSIPSSRLDRNKIPEYVSVLKEYAAKIENDIY